jgi:outer membrane protein assembly factor BamB
VKVIEFPAAPHDWPQFNFDEQHSGSNTEEIGITSQNVTELQPLFQAKLPAVSDGPAVYWAAGNRRRDHMLFFTATNGALIAMFADGRMLWQTKPPAGPRWTTSSPALDPSRKFVYSYALDGRVHKYDIVTGAEVVESGWPVLITRKPDVEKCSSALSIATTASGVSYLYATLAGYPDPGDEGDYQGHVVAIRLDTGIATTFNALCSNRHSVLGYGDCGSRQAGVWGRPGVIYDAAGDSVYIVTSNGPFDSGRNWGDSILRLPPDLRVRRGKPLDSYTPEEFDLLDKQDLDLGSSGLALLPWPGQAAPPALGVHAGKDGVIRLLSLADLSGHGAPGYVGGELQRLRLPQGGGNFSAPAVWIDDESRTWVYFANSRGIGALELVEIDGTPQLIERWRSNSASNSSPIVANGVLFCAKNGRICALDARTGIELWADTRIGDIHWQSPIVVNGAVYMSDLAGNVTAWALPKEISIPQ